METKKYLDKFKNDTELIKFASWYSRQMYKFAILNMRDNEPTLKEYFNKD
jgi:hypothetical protein